MSGPLNGKTGEVTRWVIGLAVAAIVSYFTAQSATTNRLTAVETDVKWMRMTMEKLDDRLERVIDDWGRGVDRRTGEPLPLQQSIERGK